jgi:hypothetical protein
MPLWLQIISPLILLVVIIAVDSVCGQRKGAQARIWMLVAAPLLVLAFYRGKAPEMKFIGCPGNPTGDTQQCPTLSEENRP